MNASTADFAATTPWSGITGKPSVYPTDPANIAPGSATDGTLLIFDATTARWKPVTLTQLKILLDQL